MIRRHFDRAVAEGWLPFFLEAAECYDVRSEVLMAIASRESDMGGPRLPDGSFKWLMMPGDGGHGYGLMQVDRRNFPEWVQTDAWQKPELGIYQGAKVLAGKRDGLVRRIGQTVSVRDRKTRHHLSVYDATAGTGRCSSGWRWRVITPATGPCITT